MVHEACAYAWYIDAASQVIDYQQLNWNFAGALFYTFTLITTIGYGTFVPSSPRGQLATIAFGLVGIAVSGACVDVYTTSIGGAIDQLVDVVMRRCKRCAARVRARTRSRPPRLQSVSFERWL